MALFQWQEIDPTPGEIEAAIIESSQASGGHQPLGLSRVRPSWARPNGRGFSRGERPPLCHLRLVDGPYRPPALVRRRRPILPTRRPEPDVALPGRLSRASTGGHRPTPHRGSRKGRGVRRAGCLRLRRGRQPRVAWLDGRLLRAVLRPTCRGCRTAEPTCLPPPSDLSECPRLYRGWPSPFDRLARRYPSPRPEYRVGDLSRPFLQSRWRFGRGPARQLGRRGLHPR